MTATREGVVPSRRSEAMAEIIKSHEADIDRELKEGGTPEGIAALARDGVTDGDPLRPESIPVEDWAAMSDEARGEAIKATAADNGEQETDEQKAAREAAEAKAKEDAEAAAQAAAPETKKYKGKVDGQEVEFDEQAVVEAGLRALQKESAADKRLEEASRAKEEAERLRQVAEQAATKAAQQPAATKKSDQEMVLEKDALRGIVKAIQYGGEEEAVEALQKYGERMSQMGQPNAITATELQNMLDLREAQKYVRENYTDVMGDENLKSLFVTKVNAKLAAGDARPYQDICKDIGDELRTWRGAPKQEPTQPAQGGSRAAVKERKTSVVQVPSAAARQPAPSQPKVPTATETIDKMRQARRQA